MNKYKVGIIVPVYNAEKYIDRCFNSLINQTYDNIEIILIDDGSKDNSLSVIKNYEKEYDFVKAYTHENKGPGLTRNDGINYSTADYITFVDSDDYIDNNYISLLMENIKDNDIIISGYKTINENNKVLKRVVPKLGKFDPLKFTSTCCKLYKRELLIRNNVFFSDILIGEDIYFTLKAYSYANKITSISNDGYNIITNSNSITHSSDTKHKFDLFSLCKKINEDINLDKFNNYIYYLYSKILVQNLLMLNKSISFKEFYAIYKESFNWLDNLMKKKKIKYKYSIIKGENFLICIYINIFTILRKTFLIKPILFVIKNR